MWGSTADARPVQSAPHLVIGDVHDAAGWGSCQVRREPVMVKVAATRLVAHAGLASVAALFLSTGVALAADPPLDARYEPVDPPRVRLEIPAGQTFTALASGWISRVELYCAEAWEYGDTSTVSLLPVGEDGLPSGPAIATGYSTGNVCTTPGWLAYYLDMGASIGVGQRYAIAFDATNQWGWVTPGGYADGMVIENDGTAWRALVFGDYDFAFRVYLGGGPVLPTFPTVPPTDAPPMTRAAVAGPGISAILLALGGVLAAGLAIRPRRRRG